MDKYFGSFSSRWDVASSFEQTNNRYKDDESIFKDFPSERQILIAVYDIDGYEGSAFVLFEKGGKLYEVHGGHCSCYGLEDQWKPEETSWEALAMRPDLKPTYSSDNASVEALQKLIKRRLKRSANVQESKA